MDSLRMYDSTSPANIPALTGEAVAGYLHPGDPLRPWTRKDWEQYPNVRKLPILVRSDPTNGSEAEDDAFAALRELYDLGADACLVALDIETARDAIYVTRFGQVMNHYHFTVLPYGSQSNLLSLPPLDGRWIAAPGKSLKDFRRSDGVRAVQNVSHANPDYDRSDLHAGLAFAAPWWV